MHGAERVVGEFGLRADDACAGRGAFGGDGCAAEEAAATNGGDDDVEIGHFIQQFERCGALACDDVRVVERMHFRCTGLFDHFGLRCFAGGEGGFAERDDAAIARDGGFLHGGRVAWHHDVCLGAAKFRGECESLGVIA